MVTKIDSNLTGLRYAEEASVKVLPVAPLWLPLEPNSYSDFGGEVATVARQPINPSRQRKKGTVTDLDASGGFNHDLTATNMTHLLQGFFCATAAVRADSQPLNATALTVTAVTAIDSTYTLSASSQNTKVGDLLFAQGFSIASNNGIKVVAADGSDTIEVEEALADETPPLTARVSVVGVALPTVTSAIVMSGDLVRLTHPTADFTTMLLQPGDWVYIGGDLAVNRFALNQGFARIKTVAVGYLEFDKVTWPPQAETGTGKVIYLFLGWRIRNDQLNVIRTYQLERTLGSDGSGVQSEYIVGAVANELTLNVPTADKATVDLTFVGLDNEQRSGATGVKSGTRPALAVSGNALNTSSNVRRINISSVSATDATVTPLLTYCTELTLTLTNNAQPLKAIGTLGGFDTNLGLFEIGGSLEAYFASVDAISAIRNNSDITLDLIIVESNKGILFDVPLLSLSDGRLNVEKDQPVKIPLQSSAFESPLGHTLLYHHFPYLPNAAASAFVAL